jgi:hypothetical protein
LAEHLDTVLIGDNPFIGVDHLSQDRARERLAQLNSEREARVLQTAFKNGASGFVFSTHPTHLEVFKLLREQDPNLSFDLYPLLPYAQGYVRTATEKGMIGMLYDLIGQLSWGGKMKALVGGGVSALTMNPTKMLATFVDLELDRFLRVAPPRAKLKAVFLHEIIVDLALAFQLKEIFESYISHINDHYKVRAGLVTRNFPRLIQLLDDTGISYDKISLMTPFNKLGFQMNPSREACERSLAQKPGIDVIAMSILAAGLLNLREATEYIHGLENLRSVVVGVSSEEHAVRTFQTLRKITPIEAAVPQRAPEVLARN